MPPPRGPGSGHRRAKNRRYRRNRAGRSHTTIISWNTEGLRKKIGELQRWLPAAKADVLAVQEGQLPKTAPRIPGYQPPVVVRRARGRITGAAVVKGGDVALYVRAGLHFTVIDDRMTAAADDTTEICGVRLLGCDNTTYLTIINLIVRPSGQQRTNVKISSTRQYFRPTTRPCLLETSTPTIRCGTPRVRRRTRWAR